MLVGLVLLVVLFIAGFVHTRFKLPAEKVMAWSKSLSVTANSSEVQVPAKSTTAEKKSKTGTARAKDNNKTELEGIFSTFDKNKDGFITKQELRESLKNMGMQVTETEVADMVEKADSNGDGLMDLDEFCELFESIQELEGTKEEEAEGELREAFDVFDENGDGLITVEELGKVLCSMGLKEGQRLETCKEMIKNVDVDGDGMVNFHEFKMMMRAGPRLVPVL
ncbi:hypothetical protein NMG60_11036372 [Bertholletia excelsa]